MQEDWRLMNQMNYLHRATLKKIIFKRSETNDHEHCEFCMDKFGEDLGLLKQGYCTLDEYHWICNKCFKDFEEQFEWQLVEDQTEGKRQSNY